MDGGGAGVLESRPMDTITVFLESPVSVFAPTAAQVARFRERLAARGGAIAAAWEVLRNCVVPVALLLLATCSLVGDSYNPFIYFQF